MLLRAHVLLIGSALALAVLFGGRAFVLYARNHQRIDLAMGSIAAVVVISLSLYLRRVMARPKA
jgi:hypothetical protein